MFTEYTSSISQVQAIRFENDSMTVRLLVEPLVSVSQFTQHHSVIWPELLNISSDSHPPLALAYPCPETKIVKC